MKYTQRSVTPKLLAVLVVSLATQLVSGFVSTAHAVPPLYDVEFIGGFPRAVNNTGDAVGWTLDTGISRGWIFKNGSRTLLPVPAGWHSQANDINDNGVIVGNAGSDADPTGPVLWQPNGNGYDITLINTPVDDAFGEATAINNFGDIVGIRTFMTEIRPGVTTQVTRGFLYSSSGVLTPNLSDTGFEALPTDINDNAQIVGGQLRKTQSLVEDLGVPTVPAGETRYKFSIINAINNGAQVAAQTFLATSSTLSTASRYSDGLGWQVFTLQGSFDAGLSINDGGDVTFEASFFCTSGAGKPGVYLQSEGISYCLDNLLADSNWQLNGPIHESDINNNGQILLQGSNNILSLSGAVLLTPNGPVAVPAAPQNLAATVVPANTAQPTNRVQLSWIDASDNETGFRVERRLFGSSTWSTIITLNAGTQAYNDNSVDFDQIYEYRVFATGLAGDSAASNVVTAVSPPAPPVAPTADANGPYTGTAGIAVTFDGSGSTDDGTIASYAWDFGDGSTGTGVSPGHAYAAAGLYTVTLTVTDDGGLTDSATSTATIAAANVAPTADANGLYTGTAGIAVTFDGSGSTDSDGTIASYAWDFGDGSTGTGVSPSHAYAAAGLYTVTLTVTDDGGLTDSATSTATIAAANVAPTAPQSLAATVVATASGHAVQLGWIDASDNETSFRVERKLSSDSTWSTLATLGAGSTAYEDSTVDFGQSYDYRVFAVGDAGDSIASNVVSADIPAAPPVISVPVAPHSLAAAVESASATQPTNIIQLSWIDASDNETGFRIERRQSVKRQWRSIETVDANIESYEDTIIGADGSYDYRVFATGVAGDSLPSNEVTADSEAESTLADLIGGAGSFDLISLFFLMLFTGAGIFPRKNR